MGKRKKHRSAESSGIGGGGGHKANKGGVASTLYRQHETTDARPTGAGAGASSAPGRLATEKLWSFGDLPKWLPAVPRVRQPPGGLGAEAAVEVELARARALQQLQGRWQDLCKEAAIEVPPKLGFEKWRFALKWAELQAQDVPQRHVAAPDLKKLRKGKGSTGSGSIDPVIPCTSNTAEPGLVQDLLRAGVSETAAEHIATELANSARSAALQVSSLAHKLRSGKTTMPSSQLPQLSVHKHSLDMSCGGHFVKLTYDGYDKLCQLYLKHAPLIDGPDPFTPKVKEPGSVIPSCSFICRAFALLLRYKIIQGHGFQAAAGPKVFELLAEHAGVAMELFASPLNTFLGQFCSAFPDVDRPFGSRGVFSDFEPKSGSYQANPPFVPCIMDDMAKRLLALLGSAASTGAPLAFTVFIPGWKESQAWQLLSGSSFLRKHLLIAAADHGYADGAQQQRKDSFRASCYDTGVFFLQTEPASRKWATSDGMLGDLKSAMACAVPTAAAAKRQKRSR